tara:strand:- start:1044 stop:1700 length:657 start_codon:yes stop_codon:yes gene_type:complete
MKKRFFVGITLLILFTTFISQKKLSTKNFQILEIDIYNNFILEKNEIKKDLSFLYNKNLIFLKSSGIEKKLTGKSFIKRLEIKKIYPNKLVIKVFEKEPIAIIIDKEKKFYLGKKIDLIEYKRLSKYSDLPIIYGDKKSFKILFENLKKVNFPIELIKNFYIFESKRWDLELKDKKIIRLPAKNYNKILRNFLEFSSNRNFDKYKVFDYRLEDQLILK